VQFLQVAGHRCMHYGMSTFSPSMFSFLLSDWTNQILSNQNEPLSTNNDKNKYKTTLPSNLKQDHLRMRAFSC